MSLSSLFRVSAALFSLLLLLTLAASAQAPCSSTFLFKFGSTGSGDGQFAFPSGVAVNAAGQIIVADSGNHRIQVFDSKGDFLFKFGSLGSNDGQFSSPSGVAVNAAGQIIVADSGNKRVQVFDSKGTFLFKFGSVGSNDGQFSSPIGVAVNAAGQIIVTDALNHNVQVFNSKGDFLFKFGSQGSNDGQFSSPNGVAVNAAGQIIVADSGNHRIQVFDSAGTFLFKIGAIKSGADGQFAFPIGVVVNAAGNIIVADNSNNRVQVFNSAGNFLFKFGSYGSGDGQFSSPYGVAVNAAGNIIVADTANNRVQVFAGCPTNVAPNLNVQAGGRGNNLGADVGDPAVCLDPGGLVGIEATVTNPNNAALAATFTATLPAGLTAVAGSCQANVNPGGCTVAGNGGSVTWNGNLAANQTVTIIYRAQIAANVAPGTQFCINNQATVGGVPANLQYCFTLSCPVINARVSDQKAGSVLVFPYYTSTVGGLSDTRITITNIREAANTLANQAFVHLFLIDGTTCQPADFYLCLTPKASFSFRASDFDPGNTGYLLAVVVNEQGIPIQSNILVGNAFVQTPEFADNYGAESFAANSFAVATVTGNTATLHFDQVGYDAVPKQFTVELQSPIDAPGQQIVTAGLSGDVGAAQLSGAAQVGVGTVTNELETPVGSFTNWLLGACQVRGTITAVSPRVPTGMGNLLKSGQGGTMRINVGAAVGLLLTPKTAKWNGIRTLHKTQTVATTITIPIFIPTCS